MHDSDDGAVLNDRELIRTRAYGDFRKLQARQALWAYVEDPPATSRVRWAIDLCGDEMIVDVGCGNGIDLRALRGEGHRGPLIGLDLSHGMVAWIEADLGARVVADAAQLPLVSEVVDVVLAMHMLYHVPDIAGALVEIRRVLRPEGVFLASTNSQETAPELIRPWSEAMVVAGGPPLVRNSQRSFSLEDGKDLLAQVFSSLELKVATSTSLVPDARIV